LRNIATPNANNRPIRIQLAVLKPQSDLSRPLSGSTETDGKSVELVPVPVVVLMLVVALACALAVEERASKRAEDSTRGAYILLKAGLAGLFRRRAARRFLDRG
jgi:hypothetical protein